MPSSSGSTPTHRWAGLALVDGQTARRDRGDARRLGPAVDLAAARGPGRGAAGPVGDWRGRGAVPRRRRARWPASSGGCWSPRAARASDWVSRYLLPIVEEFATERLMETRRAARMAGARGAGADGRRRVLPSPAAGCGAALALLILSTPLDLVAQRLATAAPAAAQPVAAVAAAAVAGGGAGAARARLVRGAPRRRLGRDVRGAGRRRLCRGGADRARRRPSCRAAIGCFSRRTAIWLAIPFAIGGWWNALSWRCSRSMPRPASSSSSISVTVGRARLTTR